jgi:hypothetical protein
VLAAKNNPKRQKKTGEKMPKNNEFNFFWQFISI